ncbi:hypothetical protein EJ08DRAFT_694818 [Tothia fuscella]|uniref:Uncharacterized protein n=1 Tax=Tothia fuscella TaxID=1048955 RepID=A0A9P4NVP5_9PEZI|nr:hypothetical protein EJ08DRAFT_694818 [Tothia fuscella]
MAPAMSKLAEVVLNSKPERTAKYVHIYTVTVDNEDLPSFVLDAPPGFLELPEVDPSSEQIYSSDHPKGSVTELRFFSPTPGAGRDMIAHAKLKAIEYSKWRQLQPKINRMFPEDRLFGKVSPFVPRTFEEYRIHRAEVREAEAEDVERMVARLADDLARGNLNQLIVGPFYGQTFGSFAQGINGPNIMASPNSPTRGSVLGHNTIWVPPHASVAPPWRTPAPWPSQQEMEWEGDQRVATESGRFGRFLPIPRVIDPNNTTVAWHMLPRVVEYEFDAVWRVPTGEDIWAPVEAITDPDVVASLLNKDLLDAIDDQY